MKIDDLVSRFKNIRKLPNGFMVRCPAHADSTPSLSISEGVDGRLLLKCFAGCSNTSILAAIELQIKDLFPASGNSQNGRKAATSDASSFVRKIKAIYPYFNADGTLLFENIRYEPKDFRQRRPDGNGGYVYNLQGVERVPYRLPELLSALRNPEPEIWFTEGERDADNLHSLGFMATSFKNWKPEFNRYIRGCHSVIFRDNDKVGLNQATEAARLIFEVARSVKMIDLFPGSPEFGQDVSVWIDNKSADGLGKEDIAEALAVLVEAADRLDAGAAPFATKDLKSGREFRFTFTTLEDLFREPEETLSYVWDKTLITGGFSILTGKPKVGKSSLIRPLAVAISRGEPMLGRKTAKGKVLYLCLEEKRSEVRRHFQMLHGSGSSVLIHSGSTPQTTDEAIAALRQAIEEHHPMIIFIDPLSRVIPASDFNDYRLTNQLARFVDLARETGAHICCLHHDGKGNREDSDAILGTTALFGSVDCHLHIKKRQHGRTISSAQRYGEDLPETVIELDKETGLLIEKGELEAAIRSAVKAEVLDAVGSDTLTQADIKNAIPQRNGGQISRAIVELVEEQILVRSGNGKRNEPYQYSRAGTKA
ncbi:MAG: AAA family ATPase [Acidobacteriota bacterium]|nr:MAG: AAA family ATPase [Acidobacteriota bacterium]